MQIYKKIAIFVGFKEKMMKKTIFYVILLLIAFQAIGCKKNENTTTTPSLLGLDIDGEYDNFMGENSDIWVQADVEDLYVSNGSKLPEKIGIYFTVSSNVGVRDTVTRDVDASNPRHYIHLGEAGNYTIQCFAYGGESVYNASASIAITVVNPETALTGLPEDLPTVEIGGNTFRTTTVEGKTWMANNLYGTESGRDYQKAEILTSLFGKYYTWTEAQTACPEGWHLPTAAEFDEGLDLDPGSLMVDASFVNVKMWSYWPQVTISNRTKFCAIPVGYLDFNKEEAPEQAYKKYACFWTQDQMGDRGVFRSIFEQGEVVQKSLGDKNTLALSVRCVKD